MARDLSQNSASGNEAAEQKPSGVPAGAAPSVYQATLLQIIESTLNDPGKVRRLVYELARLNLKREAWQSDAGYTAAEVRGCLLALETAISRVEADFTREHLPGQSFPQLTADPEVQLQDLNLELPAIARSGRSEPNAAPAAAEAKLTELGPARSALNRDPDEGAGPRAAVDTETAANALVPATPRQRLVTRPEPAINSNFERRLPQSTRPQVEIVYPERESAEVSRLRRRAWFWFILWPLIWVSLPIVIGVIFYVAFSGLAARQERLTRDVAAEQNRSAIQDSTGITLSGMPLPTTYGIYAISNGALSALEALPIKAPDPRIMLSAEITKASFTTIADGKVMFLVFRRELVNSAPQTASVRVVARVSHTTSFESGKPAIADVTNTWRIRSNSYEFNVSPVNETREMVAIRPATPDLVLPAGRYALVVNGFAYDFTVAGPVTEAAQCLEAFESSNGPVYTECRPKDGPTNSQSAPAPARKTVPN